MTTILSRRGSLIVYPPYQYAMLEVQTDINYAFQKFAISGLTDRQLDQLRETFDLKEIHDPYEYHFPFLYMNKYGNEVEVTELMNYLSNRFGFSVKGSTITQKNGVPHKERFILERNDCEMVMEIIAPESEPALAPELVPEPVEPKAEE